MDGGNGLTHGELRNYSLLLLTIVLVGYACHFAVVFILVYKQALRHLYQQRNEPITHTGTAADPISGDGDDDDDGDGVALAFDNDKDNDNDNDEGDGDRDENNINATDDVESPLAGVRAGSSGRGGDADDAVVADVDRQSKKANNEESNMMTVGGGGGGGGGGQLLPPPPPPTTASTTKMYFAPPPLINRRHIQRRDYMNYVTYAFVLHQNVVDLIRITYSLLYANRLYVDYKRSVDVSLTTASGGGGGDFNLAVNVFYDKYCAQMASFYSVLTMVTIVNLFTILICETCRYYDLKLNSSDTSNYCCVLFGVMLIWVTSLIIISSLMLVGVADSAAPTWRCDLGESESTTRSLVINIVWFSLVAFISLIAFFYAFSLHKELDSFTRHDYVVSTARVSALFHLGDQHALSFFAYHLNIVRETKKRLYILVSLIFIFVVTFMPNFATSVMKSTLASSAEARLALRSQFLFCSIVNLADSSLNAIVLLVLCLKTIELRGSLFSIGGAGTKGILSRTGSGTGRGSRRGTSHQQQQQKRRRQVSHNHASTASYSLATSVEDKLARLIDLTSHHTATRQHNEHHHNNSMANTDDNPAAHLPVFTIKNSHHHNHIVNELRAGGSKKKKHQSQPTGTHTRKKKKRTHTAIASVAETPNAGGGMHRQNTGERRCQHSRSSSVEYKQQQRGGGGVSDEETRLTSNGVKSGDKFFKSSESFDCVEECIRLENALLATSSSLSRNSTHATAGAGGGGGGSGKQPPQGMKMPMSSEINELYVKIGQRLGGNLNV